MPPVQSNSAVRGEPAPRLRAEPGPLRRDDDHFAADERLPGAAARGRPAGRDARPRSRRRSMRTSRPRASSFRDRRSSPATTSSTMQRDAVKTSSTPAPGRRADTLITPNGVSPQVVALRGPRGISREALRQPPRRHLPRRAFQRQQRARRRFLDERLTTDLAASTSTSPTRSSSAPAATRATTWSTATRFPASRCRSTGRRPLRARGRCSSRAPATSTATPTSSSTASGSTATSRASCAPARDPLRSARRSSRRSSTTWRRRRTSAASREGAARGDAVRPADARRQHAAGRGGAPGSGGAITPARSRPARPRRWDCARSTLPSRRPYAAHVDAQERRRQPA